MHTWGIEAAKNVWTQIADQIGEELELMDPDDPNDFDMMPNSELGKVFFVVLTFVVRAGAEMSVASARAVECQGLDSEQRSQPHMPREHPHCALRDYVFLGVSARPVLSCACRM